MHNKIVIQYAKEYKAGNILIKRNPASDKLEMEFNGSLRQFNTLSEVRVFLQRKGIYEKIQNISTCTMDITAPEPDDNEKSIIEEAKRRKIILDLEESGYQCVGFKRTRYAHRTNRLVFKRTIDNKYELI